MLGVVILAHTALDRAAQAARHWASDGAIVVLHVDRRTDARAFASLKQRLADCPTVHFAPRQNCEWGTWEVVRATQTAAEYLLKISPDVSHVYLASGSCLPLRPVGDLRRYLADFPETDFIETAPISETTWTVGGLERERFSYWFPVGWKRRRQIFDRLVDLQRFLLINRRMPKGVTAHIGSQWWCLTRRTLQGILNDPNRRKYDRYFRWCWIPDESYFQSLVHLHSRRVEKRSLTLSAFGADGRPLTFYDDHKNMLESSQCFVARKIWQGADKLYQHFPRSGTGRPDPAVLAQLLREARRSATGQRTGLNMLGRFPAGGYNTVQTAAAYSVSIGLEPCFRQCRNWMSKQTATDLHGRLYHPHRIEYAHGATDGPGGLCSSTKIRNRYPAAFLSNLLWNTRPTPQYFCMHPSDHPGVLPLIARDPNAHVHIVRGGWVLDLLRSDMSSDQMRQRAKLLSQRERHILDSLIKPQNACQLSVWTLRDIARNPTQVLRHLLADVSQKPPPKIIDMPKLTIPDDLEAQIAGLECPDLAATLQPSVPNRSLAEHADAALAGVR